MFASNHFRILCAAGNLFFAAARPAIIASDDVSGVCCGHHDYIRVA